MTIIRNFWDLENCTSYSSHFVDQFDDNTPYTGGGLFTWVENVGAVTTIPGIRIQNSANTNGYWIRAGYQSGLFAESFGVTRTASTLSALGISQATADARYGSGVVTVTTDTYDVAALRSMFLAAETLGVTKVNTTGTYLINDNVEIPNSMRRLVWDGGGATIKSTNTNNFILVSTELPADNGEAQQDVENIYTFKDLIFDGDGAGTQTGMQVGPSYGSMYTGIHYKDLSMGSRHLFNLAAHFQNIRITDTDIGVQLSSGDDDVDVVTYWTGATTENSQCNAATFKNIRGYHGTTGTAIIEIRNANGIVVEDFIMEGAKWEKGVSLYSVSTTVQNLKLNNVHYECSSGMSAAGSGDALVYVRMLGGIVMLDNIFGQYGAIMIDVDQSSGGAYTTLHITNVVWWVIQGGTDAFYNGGNAQWIFTNCANQLFTEATAISYIQGTAPTAWTAPGDGTNKYIFTPVPA